MLRAVLAERIQRTLAGGMPTDDFDISLELINTYISDAIAFAAKKAYAESIELDGIESLPDGFYTTFKNIEIKKDNDLELYYCELPAAPYGIPRGHDITNVTVTGFTGGSQHALPIKAYELSLMEQQRFIPKRIYYYLDGKKMWMKAQYVLDGKRVRIRMASPANTGLDAELDVPLDMIGDIETYILQRLAPQATTPQDNSNDGLNVK